MSSWRLLLRGGITSYRALFGWLSPWILIPMFLVGPLAQILFFSFVGKAAGVAGPSFYLVGNAIQYSAIPCLFAMGSTVGDERQMQTLSLILVAPARRLPLYLGRTLPVIINGFVVALFGLVVGSLILGVRLHPDQYGPLVATLAVSAFACTGLGLVTGALALRVRETAVLPNVIFGILLIFCGVDVQRSALPHWIRDVGAWLPLTHGIAAARLVVARSAGGPVATDLLRELFLGGLYLGVGFAMLMWFELESRRRATLERS
jgi:ABC-2 type transport system permease protein